MKTQQRRSMVAYRTLSYVLGFLFTATTTLVFFTCFGQRIQFAVPRELAIAINHAVLFLLFSPVLLCLRAEKPKLLILDLATLLGFCTGFVYSTFLTDCNIWPIALVVWLLLSVPAFLSLNLVCFFCRRRMSAPPPPSTMTTIRN